jgi:catechol 2,3-dioxygenase-like lactoylglutathione lyase family enzyme
LGHTRAARFVARKEALVLRKLHHVAYRCRDAGETARFYVELLGLRLSASLVQEYVPSIGQDDPHNHLFFALADGSFVAFFDVLHDQGPFLPSGHDWAQHLALEVASELEAQQTATRLREHGIEVIGPVDHHFCKSWYFRDPNGHRLELSLRTEHDATWQELGAAAPEQVRTWSERKRGPGAAL